MSFFKKKKLHPEDTYVVLPGAKAKALKASMGGKKHLGPVNLKKDLAKFMDEHRNDKFDTRLLSKRSLEYR